MRLLPNKLQHGDTLASLFEKFNAVIDYLREIRLVAGTGIRLNQLANGTTIESTATSSGGGASALSDTSHPFDVELIKGGTQESPEYSVRVFNSSLPESPYAGIVYIGDWENSVPVSVLAVNTDKYFNVDLVITYVQGNSPPFSCSFVISTSGTVQDNYNTYRKTIGGGTIAGGISAFKPVGNFDVSGRWI